MKEDLAARVDAEHQRLFASPWPYKVKASSKKQKQNQHLESLVKKNITELDIRVPVQHIKNNQYLFGHQKVQVEIKDKKKLLLRIKDEQMTIEEEVIAKNKAELEAHLAKQMEEVKEKHGAEKLQLAKNIEAGKLLEAASTKRKHSEIQKKVATDLSTPAKEGKRQQMAVGSASPQGQSSSSSSRGGGAGKNKVVKPAGQTRQVVMPKKGGKEKKGVAKTEP